MFCYCNDPDPPIADIILFRLSLSAFHQDFKMRLVGEGFHIGDLFSSPTNVGYHSYTL